AATGLIATPLFYAAADHVSRDPRQLAAVEATQAGEIVFTLIFEAILIGIHPPTPLGWLGIALILAGFLLHARPRSGQPGFRSAGPACPGFRRRCGLARPVPAAMLPRVVNPIPVEP